MPVILYTERILSSSPRYTQYVCIFLYRFYLTMIGSRCCLNISSNLSEEEILKILLILLPLYDRHSLARMGYLGQINPLMPRKCQDLNQYPNLAGGPASVILLPDVLYIKSHAEKPNFNLKQCKHETVERRLERF